MKRMSKRKSPKPRQRGSDGLIRPAASMPVINPHAAGVDVGASEHYACVPPDAVPAQEDSVWCFGTFTEDLDRLVDWFQRCGIRTVAMESTGVYWVVLCDKLEAAGLEVKLVNARHLRQVPGRKSDVKDCQWLQQLHSYGLLNGSFRPEAQVRRLRTLMRHRANLVTQKAEQVQHMQRPLQEMNILLHHVVSDLDGDTGFRILDAILHGERDPEELVKLRDPHIKRSTEEEMKAALRGNWQEEALLVLRQAREAYRFFQTQIEQCDRAIEKQLQSMPSAPPPPRREDPALVLPAPEPAREAKKKRKRKSGGNEPAQDLMPDLTRICGIDLTQIGGINMLGVMILVSEVGVDMSQWRSEKAFSSWLGLAPGNKISGGRVLSSKTPYVVSRIATMLRTMAVVVGRTDTWLGSFHRRMKARLGPAGAATATARKLACIIYHLLKHKEPYVEIDSILYEEKIRRQRLGRLRKQAEELGFELVDAQQRR